MPAKISFLPGMAIQQSPGEAAHRACSAARPGWKIRSLWSVNLATFAIFCVWVLADGLLVPVMDRFATNFWALFGGTSVDSPSINARLVALANLSLVALGSLGGIFVTLFLGKPHQRRMRSWLAFTALAAAWLTLLGTWRELAWHGQQWRVAQRIESFRPLANSLRNSWPTEDGRYPGLGTLMAYPREQPRLLLLLGGSPSVSAVERGESGAIRFELTGQEQGAWLEWHPPASEPASFTGGLEGRYELDRAARLDNEWFLTRYRQQSQFR